MVIELVYEVGAPYSPQCLLNIAALFWLVPEEELSLGELFARRLGAEHGLKRVGVVACVPCLGRYGHRRGREVLHLLKVKVEALGLDRQLRHVFLGAAGVAADEVRYELLAQVALTVYAVEYASELFKLGERGLAHEFQHTVRGVLWSYFESAADVLADKLAGVFTGCLVGLFVLAAIEQQVISDAAAYEAFLNLGHGVNGVVDFEQARVVCVEVGANLRVYARRALALLTRLVVAAVHAVHVCRGTAQVRQIALEVGHLHHLAHLAQYVFLAATRHELALMRRNGAESAATEATSVNVDRELNHVVGGYSLATIFRVRQSGVRQVERGVKLFGGHRWAWRVDHNELVAHLLQDALSVQFV